MDKCREGQVLARRHRRQSITMLEHSILCPAARTADGDACICWCGSVAALPGWWPVSATVLLRLGASGFGVLESCGNRAEEIVQVVLVAIFVAVGRSGSLAGHRIQLRSEWGQEGSRVEMVEMVETVDDPESPARETHPGGGGLQGATEDRCRVLRLNPVDDLRVAGVHTPYSVDA